ncbi:MAG TPA: ExeM/NucH family extracellular endonuclease [Ilumatobacteraceae bacterium]|nr:ExeM/NucH family extracellular endonuclease [Ilumatobacteraceae bacterium]
MRRVISVVVASLIASSAVALSVVEVGSAVSPDVVISQVYGGGGNSGATYTNDFIELYNRGTEAVPLDGWTVQYASSAGTTWAQTPLSGTLPAGSYYLVQEAQGAGGTTPLPTPDATGTIAMSGTSGKVALVTSSGALACGSDCDTAAGVRDFVGYGAAANDSETAPTPTLSNTTAAIRAAGGATDTDNNSADFSVGAPTPRQCGDACEPPPPPSGCDVAPTHQIAGVQGTGTSTPVAGATVRVEGVVTADLNGAGQFGGFYVQDDTPDADPASSEGIFVVSSAAVSVADRVLVSGTASESFGQTQVAASVVDVCGTGTITATSYDLPRPVGVTFEPVESMVLTFPEALSATEHFQLGRFGEVTVSSDGRLFQPTDRVAPGAPAIALADENQRRRLLIDDGSNVQNPPTVPFLTPDVLRLGDTATGITGVLGFGFGNFRVQPTQPITFARTNPRPSAPADVGGDVRVASFNTLNYFTTIDNGSNDARGADSAAEFARQRVKEVEALLGLDADVVGLMEIENNGAVAVGDLVSALNDATAPGTYAAITEPVLNPPNSFGGTFGTDAIKVALIYRPAAVTPVGPAASSADPVFDRPPLIQTFERVGGSEDFTLTVNHFKSKNCGTEVPPHPDADLGDGQSCFNNRRVLQATALAGVLDSLDVPNPLVIGDLNAYTEEDPIHVLEAAGYTGLSESLVADDDRYSFVFDGFSGELDHALAGPGLFDNVTGMSIWHINADEPLILDYNTEFNPPGLYQPDAYRSSDHDPFIVGLELSLAPSVDAGGPYTVVEGDSVTVTATGTDPEGGALTYAWDLDNNGTFETAGQSATYTAAPGSAPSSPTIAVQATDGAGQTAVDTATVNVIWRFDGFVKLRQPPGENQGKGGDVVIIKFTLGGDQGLGVLAAAYPRSIQYTCGAAIRPTDAVEPTTPTPNGGLSYSAATQTYTYRWLTQTSWSNTCRRFVLKLADGTFHYVDIKFKK